MENSVDRERNYSFEDIEIDPRFRVCEFEMKLTFAVWFAYMFISVGLSYYFGRGDVADYTYLWGVPFWVVVGAWLPTAVFFGIVIYIALFVFKNMDITS